MSKGRKSRAAAYRDKNVREVALPSGERIKMRVPSYIRVLNNVNLQPAAVANAIKFAQDHEDKSTMLAELATIKDAAELKALNEDLYYFILAGVCDSVFEWWTPPTEAELDAEGNEITPAVPGRWENSEGYLVIDPAAAAADPDAHLCVSELSGPDHIVMQAVLLDLLGVSLGDALAVAPFRHASDDSAESPGVGPAAARGNSALRGPAAPGADDQSRDGAE